MPVARVAAEPGSLRSSGWRDHFRVLDVVDREASVFRIRHLVLALPFVVLAPVTSLGADPRPMATLKEKGLLCSGRLFVLEAEDSVLEKVEGDPHHTGRLQRGNPVRRMNEAEQAARGAGALERGGSSCRRG